MLDFSFYYYFFKLQEVHYKYGVWYLNNDSMVFYFAFIYRNFKRILGSFKLKQAQQAILIVNDSCRMTKKSKDEFRNYEDSKTQSVRAHYKLMRENQSLEFVKKMHLKYNFEGNVRDRFSIRYPT